MEQLDNFINGAYHAPLKGDYLDNFEPATGSVYSRVANSGAEDVQAACQAAAQAFEAWSTCGSEQRGRHLHSLASALEARMHDFARAESRDNGKPISLASKVDIPRAVRNLEFFAAAASQFASESHYSEGLGINYTLRRPLGVVACISPWNLPLYLFTWKIAPALAAGNTVVAKPSELTPYTAYLLGEVMQECGFPPGVLNVVQGSGNTAGAALCAHPYVQAVSFTGGTQTGQRIMQQVGPSFKKVSLELGGKNPTLLFADCDFDKALKTTVQSSFANQGQICLCGSRILIERSMYERFRDAFVERVRAIIPDDPSLPSTKMGALVSEAHLQKVISYIELAKEEGGRLLCGGERIHPQGERSKGYYLSPAIFEGLGPQCRVNQEEIFGPVVTLQPFDTEAEALALANASSYGLAASVWTSDLSKAHRVAEALHCGIVWVNCWLERDLRTPFGGMKQSGLGREGGMEAMRFFTEPKNVCIAYHG